MSTTGNLWGSGTPTTTTSTGTGWLNTGNATGTNNATVATWDTNTALATASIRLDGFGAQTAIGSAPSSVDSVSVTVYSFIASTSTRISTIDIQLTSAGTPIGTAQSMTKSTSSTNSQTFTFTGVTWSNLADLGVRVTFNRTSSTSFCLCSVDAISADVTFTPASATPVGSGSGAFGWAGVGSGSVTKRGLGSGAYQFVGSGSGVAPTAGSPSGSGSGAFAWVGSGVGSSSTAIPNGSGGGSYGWDGLGFGPTTGIPVTTCVIVTPVGVLPVVPLVPATDLDHAVPVLRKSVLAPVLTAAHPAHPAPGSAGAPAVVEGVVGYVHLWINGQDVTYFRGGMTIIRRWESEAPFGDTVAAFEFPQLNPWDVPGEGDLSFLRSDVPVVIGIVSGGTTRRVWEGFLDARGNGLGADEDYTWEAKGTLWQAQSRVREPHSITEPVDIGVWIARVMNATEGRRWKTMPWTPIGITTLTRGARDEMNMEYAQTLLSEALTDDLRQWTLAFVAPGVLRLVLKPAPSTVHATVAYGTPGVDVSLRVDQSTRVDRVYMRGIGPKMAGWANIFYPHLELLRAPAYPMAGLANITAGTTDADTTTGHGVTDWQRRVAELSGFANPPVSGVMSSAWVAVVDDLQRRVGVTPDGSLGPQTWNATFDRGIPDPEALTPRRLSMASKPAAEKYLYSATGRILGANPAYDKSMIVRDIAIDAGPGKSKAQGFALARKILGRYGTAAANGTITFTLDPNETDRTRISHLSNIKVRGFEGSDRVLQVASKTVELEAGDDGPTYVVSCRVDERARDATAVEDLLEQRRSAMPDISRNPTTRNRASRQVTDQRIPWDSESPCGILRRTAVNGASGLWTVVTIPFAEVGKLAGIRLHSDRPFALAIFASLRITENKLSTIVGDPFATSDPWRDQKGLLDDYGIIEAWGEKDQACGYSPKTEGDGAAFTGEFILDTPVDYWTETPPYVSVAIYMRGGSGWISGEFTPAYET